MTGMRSSPQTEPSSLTAARDPVCVPDRRAALRAEHIARSDFLAKLTHRLHRAGHISEDEAYALYGQSESEWDDAIHIASTSDPLRSLCGSLGRNLVDLPERPDSWGGCWTCLLEAEKIAPVEAEQREAVPA